MYMLVHIPIKLCFIQEHSRKPPPLTAFKTVSEETYVQLYVHFLIIISLYNYLVYLDVFVLSGDAQNNRFIFTAIIPTRSNYCTILGYHTN
jgi:hypothetical protein